MTYTLHRDGITAFYIAEAGFERGMIEISHDWDWGGINDVTFDGGSYTVAITSHGNARREITSTGFFHNTQKQVTMWVGKGTQEVFDNNGNHYGWRNKKDKTADTWREL
jgi:hypothetical protein